MEYQCDLSETKYYKESGIRVGFTTAGGFSWEKQDCGVTALSVTCDIPYSLSHALLKLWGRQDGGYTPRWPQFIRNGPIKWKRVNGLPVTIREFARRHPVGRYAVILRPRSYKCHLLSIVDGTVLNGNIDSTRCRIAYAWKFLGLKDKLKNL